MNQEQVAEVLEHNVITQDEMESIEMYYSAGKYYLRW